MSSKLVVCCEDIAIFRIFKMAAAAIYVWNSEILLAIVANGSRHISMPNFLKFGQTVGKILRFFRFFKMAAAAILDCRIHKILLADRVRGAQPHHCNKFRQNRSFHCGDIAILQIFKMAATAILDFWNREMLLGIAAKRVETHQHAKLYEIRPIGCEYITIFSFFQDGGRRHLGLSNSQNFIGWPCPEGPDASWY